MIFLPSCQEELDAAFEKAREKRKQDYDTDSEDDDFRKKEDETEDITEYPDFPDFDKKIRESLSRVGGRAFIKLNWSSPKDAFWSLNKTSCETLSDVYTLLRSSDFISHDVNHPFDGCEDVLATGLDNLKYYLVMRRWVHLNPMMEFRCFVRDNNLIGPKRIF